ncbi:MAG: U32 family peptidase [Clostridiales bacterium]|nr:U32 family peptidase [Clostridiales bacterium]
MPSTELLAPAGDMEALETALRFGADAVYIGGPKLQLRAAKAGFSMEGVAEAAKRAHALGRKLYVTVNAFCDDQDIHALGDYAQALHEAGTDAAIVADLGAIRAIRRTEPRLPVHVSTQANCLNAEAALTYRDMGAARVVLGREMTLKQIEALHRRAPDIELEAFVHGAMCMAYSGRCMISAALTGRSANRGACTQPCRWTYHLMEEKRPGQFFPVEEDDRGMAILSSFDLNALGFIDSIAAAGVTSFKIEGRMKSPYYVATVVNAYRRRLDGYPDTGALQAELDSASHRPYSSGFYFGELRRHAGDQGVYIADCRFVANVLEDTRNGVTMVRLRNRIKKGDVLEILSPRTLGTKLVVDGLLDGDGNAVDEAAVPDRTYGLIAEAALERGDFLRIRTDEGKGA